MEPSATTHPYAQILAEAADAAMEALLVAAMARTPVLLLGQPGCGKTIVARRLGALLPPDPEGVAAGRAAAAAACLGPSGARPFRAPHYTCSEAGLVGGPQGFPVADSSGSRELGPARRPGEVHLAMGGVLFLDEVSEFRLLVLDAAARQCRALGALRPWIVMADSECPMGRCPSSGCSCQPARRESKAKHIAKCSEGMFGAVVRVSLDAGVGAELARRLVAIGGAS